MIDIISSLLFGFVVLFAGGMYLYSEFNAPVSTASIKKRAAISNIKPLRSKLNYDKQGEPLVMYSNNHLHKYKAKNDHFRLEQPVYTVPTSERGLVVGVSGSGKTNYILAQIADYMKSGKTFVVTDVKPEIWGIVRANGLHKHFNYKAIVINPTDPKAHKYNVFDDCDVGDYQNIIELIISSKTQSDIAFVSYARRVMLAVAHFLHERDNAVSLTSIYKYIVSMSHKKMINELKKVGGKATEVITLAEKSADNEKFVASGLTALVDALDFLSDDVIATNVATSDVSLREATKQKNRAIYLQFEQNENAKNQSLYAVTVMQLIRILKSNHAQRDDVFLMFDELSNASKITGLEKEFNLMRTYKMPAFVYIQTVASLHRLFDNFSDIDHFLNATNFKLFFRTNDSKSAIDISNICGQTTAYTTTVSQSPKVNEHGKKYNETSTSTTAKQVQLVEPDEVLRLGPGKGIAWYGGACAVIDVPQHYYNIKFNKRATVVRPKDLRRSK